ncbi:MULTISPECIES: DHA2 family efflux MFS transporter permease subunit [Rhodomicrobium]|uniref:DHA2 family efflux MFS transporter permease subunit n=1 Tax=Rhodomicrobium TaxID=1068 RepID=UPI000B4B08D7|nr:MULTISPECIES: DHA2 family efflux MFS transporter permease subunit [Rhodomicrobium]
MSMRTATFGPEPSLATWAGFAAMCTGMFMAVLDIQVVASSLPTIQEELGIRPDQMSWVQTSYLIAEIVAIPLTGLLTRALTMRRLSVITIAAFTVASIGCALSGSFETLIMWRVIQGLAGGLLIPQVFAAGFALFPGRGQSTATAVAGVLAVLAPTLGPIIGGWITGTYSWPWLFLINVLPGIAAAITAYLLLPRERGEVVLLRGLDVWGLLAMVTALACLEIGLKQAPHSGWVSFDVLSLFTAAIWFGWLFVQHSLSIEAPLVDLRTFADRRFALGALLSFLLGMSLYGMVYLMPVFLAFVRGHDAWDIGQVMIVTGVAQLLMAPLVVSAERKVDARLLTVAGFTLLAVGLAMSMSQSRATDYDEMFVPQLVRGAAIMLCLLPPIRVALAHLPPDEVANASGLFNLMRNLGGAIGLALIDTVIYGRAPMIGEQLRQALERGDVAAAKAVGLPMERFLAHVPGTPLDPSVAGYVRAAVERQAMVQAINEAWAIMATLTLIGVLLVLASLLRAPRRAALDRRPMARRLVQEPPRQRLRR